MQAIILAAGMGRRLRELTKDNTKCMVKVNGEPLIDRLLRQLSKLGLSRVVIVVGHKRENLISHIGNRYDDVLNIEYVENPIYDKTNNIYSLALAKDKLVEDDTLLIESDLILDDRMFSLILGDAYPNLALVAKYRTWMDGTMVRIDDENNVVAKTVLTASLQQAIRRLNLYPSAATLLRVLSLQSHIPFTTLFIPLKPNIPSMRFLWTLTALPYAARISGSGLFR